MTILSQQDKRWANDKIGSSSRTIGHDGCALTSFCNMVNALLGSGFTPDFFAHDAACFTADGLSIWWKLCEKVNKALGKPCIRFTGTENGENDVRLIQALKDPKKAAIVQVNSGAHFELLWHKDIFGRLLAADPWTGKVSYIKKTYHNISGARYFEKI